MSLGTFELRHQVLVGEDVYVTRVDCNCSASQLASATSENSIAIFDPATMGVVQRLEGHGDGIEDISWFQSHPSCLSSCSRDGFARVWDLRAEDPAVRAFELRTDEAYTCSVGRGDNALACGAAEKVHLFDIAAGKRLTIYKETHTDTVNHVRFHPVDTTKLMTGSVDSLVALLNTNEAKEDQALLAIIPNEECVESFECVGPNRDILCSVSTTDQVRIWGIGQHDFGSRKAEFLGMRQHPLLSDSEGAHGYVVSTFYDEISSQVFLLAGCNSEDEAMRQRLLLFRVGLPEPEVVASLSLPKLEDQHEANPLLSGHTGMVRSAVSLPGGVVFTSGEDGLICCWSGQHEEASIGLEPSNYAARKQGRLTERSTPY